MNPQINLKQDLVAKDFTQKEGFDYFDTYSPITKIVSIKTLITLAAIFKLEIHQMDVKTIFLNGDLEEKIYMEQPALLYLDKNIKFVTT